MSDPLSNALKLSNDFQKSGIYADYSQRIYILHYYYLPANKMLRFDKNASGNNLPNMTIGSGKKLH